MTTYFVLACLVFHNLFAPENARAQGRRQSEDAMVAETLGGKQGAAAGRKNAIESYLKRRLERLDRMLRTQQEFGRKFGSSWESFWNKIYEERKLFEVRIARQRLNLFESLASLQPAAHAQTITDYDKLQSTQIRSFEENQRDQMNDFFMRVMGELKQFSLEQEKMRADFTSQSIYAWQEQKKSSTLIPQ